MGPRQGEVKPNSTISSIREFNQENRNNGGQPANKLPIKDICFIPQKTTDLVLDMDAS